MASTQTGTCLMVVALCFVLVLGSLAPCLPELSTTSHMVKSSPLPSADIYTTSQVRSRSLLLYDEGAALEGVHGSFLRVEAGDGWDGAPLDYTDEQPKDMGHGGTHETNKYLSQAQSSPMAYDNRTGAPFLHNKEPYHKREPNPDDGAEYF